MSVWMCVSVWVCETVKNGKNLLGGKFTESETWMAKDFWKRYFTSIATRKIIKQESNTILYSNIGNH